MSVYFLYSSIVCCIRINIREYGSTLYVGMVRVVSFSLYIGIRAKIRNRLKIAEKSYV